MPYVNSSAIGRIEWSDGTLSIWFHDSGRYDYPVRGLVTVHRNDARAVGDYRYAVAKWNTTASNAGPSLHLALQEARWDNAGKASEKKSLNFPENIGHGIIIPHF